MSLLEEIKRRKVFQVAAVYAVVAWLLIQVADVILPAFEAPTWVLQVVVFLMILGFPMTLIMSWAFDLTSEGVVRDQGTNVTAQGGSRRIEFVLIGLLVVAVGWLVYRDIAPSASPTIADISPALDLVESESQPDMLPNSIAVLPFENLSPDPEDAFFAAGIHESTLNQLAKIHDLAVMSRTSVMQYIEDRPSIPEIAKTLKAQMIMEGSVRYAGGRVLITAQLIDGRTDTHLWSEEFNRELTDIFAIQTEVAEHIALAMQVQLLPEERARIANRLTESTEAYEYYLRALSFPDWVVFPEYLPAYIDSMERAIEVDPDFSDAYALLAHGYYTRGDREVAIEYAQRAIELGPTSGRAYDVLSVALNNYHTRQGEARVASERAVELSPNDPWILLNHASQLAQVYNDYAAAFRLGERALAVDPDGALPCPCGGIQGRLGFIYLEAGELTAAASHLREAIRLYPDIYLSYLNLATVEYLTGETAAAKENLDRAVELLSAGAFYRAGYLTYLYGLMGDTKQAKELLARQEKLLDDPQREQWRPMGWAILGTRDKDRALREWTMTIDGYLLEGRPVAAGRITRFRDNWLNDPILEEPEFLELRRRLGFKG
jgi:adenylate cyclase